jgi:hypothetical protein
MHSLKNVFSKKITLAIVCSMCFAAFAFCINQSFLLYDKEIAGPQDDHIFYCGMEKVSVFAVYAFLGLAVYYFF